MSSRSLLAVGVLALAVVVIWLLLPSDDALVRKRLAKLASVASFRPDDSTLARLAKGERLRDFFVEEIEVRFESESRESRTFNNRAELMEAITAARTTLREARVQLRDIELKFDVSKNSVSAAMLLLVDLDGEKNAITQGVVMNLRRVDGTWRLTRIETAAAR